MTKPGPSVTSGADTQPGSDSLFPSGFGGGAAIRTGGVGTAEIADASVAAADLNLPSVATALAARSEFTGTYAGLTSGGNRLLVTGDSITVGNGSGNTKAGDPSNNVFGDTFNTYAALGANGAWGVVYNAGIAGQTSAQIAARFASDLAAHPCTAVLITAGTNDAGGAVPLATTIANIKSMVAIAYTAHVKPILTTLPPRGVVGGSAPTAAIILATQQINQWVRRYCAFNNIPCLDYAAAITDPATGYYPTGYSPDGVHPHTLASRVAGLSVGTALAAAAAPGGGAYRGLSNVDPTNIHTNGLFVNVTGSLPTGGWSNGGAGTATVTTASASGFLGNALTVAVTASGGKSITGPGVSISGITGHILQVSFKVQTTGNEAAGQVWQVGFRQSGNVPGWMTCLNIGGDTTSPLLWVGEGVVGSSGFLQFQINTSNSSATAGTIAVGELQVTDLTAQGILTP